MGYYTESHFKFTLKEDTPKEVLEVLDGMFNGGMLYYANLLPEGDSVREYLLKAIENKDSSIMLSVAETPNLPIDHAFGRCTRWDQFTYGSFNPRTRRVVVNSDIKAYMQEPYKFLSWLSPYIVKSRKKKGTYLGWIKGEDQTDQIHFHLEQFLDPESFLNKYFLKEEL